MICLGFTLYFVIEKTLEIFHIGHSHNIDDLVSEKGSNKNNKVLTERNLKDNEIEV